MCFEIRCFKSTVADAHAIIVIINRNYNFELINRDSYVNRYRATLLLTKLQPEFQTS